ncbi:MAG TPA: DUF4397 domain-containing protein [Cyclobacteriaceae bacterium]|nr:DUF4397 domain-containing protein [Cyclobacteriaceae bacterium]
MSANMSKNKFSTFWTKGLGMIALALLPVLTSCLDDDDERLEPVPVAYVSFYHGSPKISSLQIEVDHRPYNTNTFDYSTYFDYGRFYTGDRNFSFKVGNAANSLLDTLVKFEADKAYSFFISEEEDGFIPIIVEDDLDSPASGKALVRLIHLSPDAPKVSLLTGEDGEELFTNQGYREISDFEEIEAGRLDLNLVAADGESLVTASNVSIKEGRIYTLVVRGYKDSSNTANSLSLQLVRNYPNY